MAEFTEELIDLRKGPVLADDALAKEVRFPKNLRAVTRTDDLLRLSCDAYIRMDRAATGRIGPAAFAGAWPITARQFCRLPIHHENGGGGTFPPPPSL